MFACTANNDNFGQRLVNNRLVLLVQCLYCASTQITLQALCVA